MPTPYSPEKLRNTKRVMRNFVSKWNENLAPVNNNNNIHGGLLFSPPPLPPPSSIYFSYPPPPALLMNPLYQNQQQPPLLPLPNSPPLHRSLPARIKPISSSHPNRKTNRNKDQTLAPKKSKSKPIKDLKPAEASEKINKSAINPSVNPIERNPKRSSSSLKLADPGDLMKDLEISPGSGIFTLSPPPSSLPLPKFALRSKLSCKAETAGIDAAGASDDLRRLLRLH